MNEQRPLASDSTDIVIVEDSPNQAEQLCFMLEQHGFSTAVAGSAIESVNLSLRKITKNRGSFPSDETLLKLFYLALRNISQNWTMSIRDWKAAFTRFTKQPLA